MQRVCATIFINLLDKFSFCLKDKACVVSLKAGKQEGKEGSDLVLYTPGRGVLAVYMMGGPTYFFGLKFTSSVFFLGSRDLSRIF